MKKIIIIPYNPNLQNEWNNFVSKAKNATFLFNRGFMDYHQERFQEASVLVYEDDKLIAIFPANRVEHTIFSHQGLSYGGLIISNKLKLNDYLIIVNQLVKFYQDNGVNQLIVKQIPAFYCSNFSDEWAYAAFLLQAKTQRIDTSAIINLKEDLNYSKDRKDGIKRGMKNELKVVETDDFSEFWQDILIPNLENRHGVKPVHRLDEIMLLKRRFTNQIRQFNVYQNNQIVAGTTIFETDLVAHSQYISANDDRSILGSLDFLHDYLFKEVFHHKKYFDFGISNENNGQKLNQGLNYWKQSFGAQICANFVHEIDLSKTIDLTNVLS